MFSTPKTVLDGRSTCEVCLVEMENLYQVFLCSLLKGYHSQAHISGRHVIISPILMATIQYFTEIHPKISISTPSIALLNPSALFKRNPSSIASYFRYSSLELHWINMRLYQTLASLQRNHKNHGETTSLSHSSR